MKIGHDLLGWYLYKNEDSGRLYWNGVKWGYKRRHFRTKDFGECIRDSAKLMVLPPEADIEILSFFDELRKQLAASRIDATIERTYKSYLVRLSPQIAWYHGECALLYSRKEITALTASILQNKLYDYMEKEAYNMQLDHDNLLVATHRYQRTPNGVMRTQ